MANGQVSNVTVTVIAPASGSLTNTASVSSPTADTNLLNNMTPPVITTVTPLADVGVSKTGPAGIIFGTNFSYTISVTNFGPSTATALSVTDNLPSGLVFVSALPAAATNAINQVVWNSFGNLAANTGTNLTLTVISTTRGSVTNVASGGSPVLDLNPTNNVTPPVVTAITNNPPVANPDVYSVAENSTNSFSPLVNDVVLTPGGNLTLVSVSPTNGTASISGTNVIFTPALNFIGVATIGYTITDNVGGTNTSLITVTVTNNPPLANPDSYAVGENSTNTLSPLVNDVLRTPGGTLSIVSVSATNGTATISGANIIFVPSANFTGTATIGYSITDNIGGMNNSLITVTVTNLPPAANPDFYGIGENSGTNTFSPLVNDVVLTPGGNLVLVSVSPTNGTASISGTNVLFAPATNFLGTATIGYTITNNVGGTNTGLITIAVTNRPPVAVNDVASTAKNVAVTIPVLANDSDPDFNPLTIVSVSPTNGTASISGTNVVFTPATNFVGTAFVGYVITDGNGGTNAALVTISVTNRPPVAVDDLASAPENVAVTIPVLVNDSDPDGDALTIVSVSPTNGTASISGTNVIFTPATNFLGTATAGYVITDGFGGTNSAVITITVTNVPPLANPDSYAVGENSTNTLSPLVNDVLRTPGGTLSIVSVSATNGTAAISGTNVIFIPATNFLGTATIGYTITDGVGGISTGLITVTVANLPPLANPDVFSMAENTTNSFSPLANDAVLTPGGNLTLVSLSPTNGTATIAGTNVLFTPALNFLGSATIGYTITDNVGGTNSSLITITVTNVPPVANPDSYAVSENSTNALSPLVNDVLRTPGGTLSILNLNATNGTATISGTNVIFTPANNFTGVATVGYTITDNVGGTNSSLITITVTNRPPVANPDSYAMAENTTNAFAPLLNDVLVTPGGALAVFSVSPTNGTATIIGGTSVQFIPSANFLGTATIGYTITDNVGGTSTSLITVTVTNVPPVANPDSYAVNENSTNTLSPLVNDVLRTPGGTLSIVSVSATNGTATISGTNVIFTPTLNFLGTATIGYTISDNVGGTSSAVITVTVDNVPPAANPDFYAIGENSGTNVLSPLVNDTLGTPGGSLTIIAVNPTNGTASISGTNVDFVPATNFLGTATIGYTIIDNIGGTNTGLITVTVTNLPPLANPDVYNVAENSTNTLSPLVNDVLRTPGGNLTIVTVNPTNGTAAISGTNVIFTPALNFVGVATIGYTITDNIGGTNSSFITITVTNVPPVANPDSYAVSENSTNTLNPLVNDVLRTPGGNLALVSVTPTNGTTSISGTNVTFTPALNFVGMATIGYVITDNVGGTSSSVITIAVTNVPPLANPDTYSQAENTTNNFSPLVNDVLRTPGGNLTIISVSPTNGTATIIGGTNVQFIPTVDFIGTATMGYVITDNVGGTNNSLITITVTNVPPMANPDSYAVSENSTNTLSPLVNDVLRTPGGTLSIVSMSPTNGTATISGTNVIFTPANNFTGTATIGYVITDNVGGTNNSLITVTVTNVPPLANPTATR